MQIMREFNRKLDKKKSKKEKEETLTVTEVEEKKYCTAGDVKLLGALIHVDMERNLHKDPEAVYNLQCQK